MASTETTVAPAPRARAFAAEAVIVVGLYAATTFALFFPLFVAPGSTLFAPAIRGPLSQFSVGDMETVMWVLSWDAHALWTNPSGLFNANIFHPAPLTLTSTEHMLGHLPIFGPVYAMWGNPVLAHQATLFAALTLCGASMYALLRHWGVGRVAAFGGGIVFAYFPLRLVSIVHVQVMGGQYLVLAIIALDRLLLTGRKRWAAAFAMLIALQCLCSFYLAYMSLVALAGYGVAILARRGARPPWRRLAAVAAAGAIGLVPFLLLALPYLAVRETGTLPFAQKQDLLRYLSVHLDRLFFVREEGYYAGMSVALLAVVGLIPGGVRSSVEWARSGALALAVVCIAFSMGPVIELGGVVLPSPYDWAAWAIPGFSTMRGPVRFVLIVMVGLSALVGFGLDRLARVRRPMHGAGTLLAVAALALIAWDYKLLERDFPVRAVEVGARVPPVYRALAGLPPGPVVEIPAGGRAIPFEMSRESSYTFRSINHWQRLLNGRSGYEPPSYPPLMALARALPDERALELLQRAAGLRYVVVHFKRVGKRARLWMNPPGLRRVGTYGESVVFEVADDIPSDLRKALLESSPSTSVLGTPLVTIEVDQRRAELSYREPPSIARAGLLIPVELVVRNPTNTPWPAFVSSAAQRVRLGCRWRDGSGVVVSEEVDADWLPYDLLPGESASVSASVYAAVPVGVYGLTIGVTQGEHWFAGTTEEVSVRVVAIDDTTTVAPPADR